MTHVAAGGVVVWLRDTQAADGIDVPCGTCTACCRSSYFVHVEPDEAATLAAIPRELLFPSPGLGPGHVVMGYDERGHCPMLVDDRCSIYEVRPRTCRRYDCRIYAATGLDPDDDGKPHIATRVREWVFDTTDEDDRALARLRRAVDLLRSHPEVFSGGSLPSGSLELALAAVKVVDLLRDGDPSVAELRAGLRE